MPQEEPPHQMLDAESHGTLKRNPHPDFKKVESTRPSFDHARQFHFTKTPLPDWQPGGGASDGGACLQHEHVEIDPYAEGRPAVFNYKLLISGIIPRPIGFVSTRNREGSSTNLAPFSYTNVVNHDPPVFIIGYAGGFENAKDSLKNLVSTGECTINIISEHYLEAANYCAINAPYGTSEWAMSGLTPTPSTNVKPDCVKEAVFSIEGKLMETKEFTSPATGKKTGVVAIIEGVRFHVREDALNDEQNLIDPNILRPMSRLGGITYARTLDAIEIPRPDFAEQMKSEEVQRLAQPRKHEQ
ncbi:MAG: hypothetical protein Q9162_005102 [Coniocarpon cinnabarinum]